MGVTIPLSSQIVPSSSLQDHHQLKNSPAMQTVKERKSLDCKDHSNVVHYYLRKFSSIKASQFQALKPRFIGTGYRTDVISHTQRRVSIWNIAIMTVLKQEQCIWSRVEKAVVDEFPLLWCRKTFRTTSRFQLNIYMQIISLSFQSIKYTYFKVAYAKKKRLEHEEAGSEP